jgi:hypothetical protein
MAARKKELGKSLSPLLEGDALQSAFRRRRDEHEYQKISSNDEKKYLQDDWVLHKRTQSYVWMKRQKSAEVVLEDRIWCLLYWPAPGLDDTRLN